MPELVDEDGVIHVYENVPVDSLIEHPRNARRSDDALIAEMIRRNGFHGVVLAQTSTRFVLVGNGRLRAMRRLGRTTIPTEWIDCDDDLALEKLAGDNRASDLGGYDDAELLTLLTYLADSPRGLDGAGYAADDLLTLMERVQGPGAPFYGDDPDMPRANDERYTPAWVFDGMGLRFDLDVAAPVAESERVVPADRFFTIHDDGLSMPWEGLVWMNPPYSAAAAWMRRWVQHPDGVCLCVVGDGPHVPECWERVDLLTLIVAVEFTTPFDQSGGIRWPIFMAARGAGVPGLERLAKVQNWPTFRATPRPRPDEPMRFRAPEES